jgi:hypothetical protein
MYSLFCASTSSHVFERENEEEKKEVSVHPVSEIFFYNFVFSFRNFYSMRNSKIKPAMTVIVIAKQKKQK